MPVGDSSADTAGGKAAIAFGNAGLALLRRRRTPCCPTRAGTWSVPVGAVRVEGITVVGRLERTGLGPFACDGDVLGILRPEQPPARDVTRALENDR